MTAATTLVLAATSSRLPDMPWFVDPADVAYELRRIDTIPSPDAIERDRPTMVLVDRALLDSAPDDAAERLRALIRLAALVGVGDAADNEPRPVDLLTTFIPHGASPTMVRTQLGGALRHAVALRNERQRAHELAELTHIGAALSTEHDLLRLLEMILSQARRISGCDAGSVYLAESGGVLRLKLSQNASRPDLPLGEVVVPFDHTSLAGHAAVTGEPLVIDDVYLLPEDAAYRQNRSFDEKYGYRTRSMLVIPMKSHRDQVVGVLQLINRIGGREVLPFDERSVELIKALASQGAVAIENTLLYENIERLLEGFVTAAATAIESRDPSTYGHSARVAALSVALAEAVGRGGHGAHRGLTFTRAQLRELRYAGLLHDFGKVGVREQVLIKEKKLYPRGLDVIRLRFVALVRAADVAFERERAEHLARHGREGYDARLEELDHARRETRGRLDRYFQAVLAANEPTLLSEDGFQDLRRLSGLTFRDLDGEEHEVLTGEELRWLTIRRGTLDEAERREIESHVMHTYRFLQQIPWTPELQRVPDIALAHHEKLNGHGYPRGVVGEAIPVQTRIMAIADIYDALTAADRPYKRAVSPERALDILTSEANAGELDADLLATFIEARLYDGVTDATGPATDPQRP
ncbi:MAG TPA: HD domain-containing phosphohydrolase [Gemmatimonadaceae bacterium]|jgi:HD-GYP domain-containing protein (c-di-GMP phosphodiesterase class II)|nr:HD domain-containing phosphohydrolase [Gemmatimonadaceae bacterium]